MCSRDNEPLLGLIWLKFEWSLVHKDKHKLPLLSSAQFHTWAHSYFMKVTQWALHVPSWWKVLSWVSEETKRDPEDESEAVFSETAGWLEGREGIKKKKRLWMNESLRGEKQRRVGKVCVCEQSRYTHTHSCQDWLCLQPSFLFPSHSSKLSSSFLSSLPPLTSIVFVSQPGNVFLLLHCCPQTLLHRWHVASLSSSFWFRTTHNVTSAPKKTDNIPKQTVSSKY